MYHFIHEAGATWVFFRAQPLKGGNRIVLAGTEMEFVQPTVTEA